MATEIFIEPELENLSETVNAEEWKTICDQLNLTGQNKMIEKSEKNMPPPYMYIDEKTQAIISTLCPRRSNLADYNSSTIPLDVLQEAKKCVEHGWYPGGLFVYADDKSPDPFLVGKLSTEWNGGYHLIARWGAEMIPFEMLEEKAVARMRDSALKALNKCKYEIEFALSNVDTFLRLSLSGEQKPNVNFDVSTFRGW